MTEVPPSDDSYEKAFSLGRFEWEQSGERRLLRVLGEVDLSNARHVLEVLEGLGDRDLVVDLTEVEFMDSTGLGTLVELESKTSGEVKLMVMARSQVDRLLELTGLKTHFDIDVISQD